MAKYYANAIILLPLITAYTQTARRASVNGTGARQNSVV